MAKKTIKVVQVESEVDVCDVCRSELPDDGSQIDVTWTFACPRDWCLDEYGTFNYCSYKHFLKGLPDITEEIKPDDDFYRRSLTISVSSEGQDGALVELVKSLTQHQ